MIDFLVLDLAPIVEGGDAARAFANSLDLARHAETWGFRRYWLAEHHNMPGIASSATSLVISHVASGTTTIRVGAGGVMLPNHSPLVIAEQFGTLESLYPGRIDLGLGRAPGTDPLTTHALRRSLAGAESFPADVVELQSYFGPVVAGQHVKAVPGAGLKVPIWLLGSSLYSAQLAAALGLPFSFASHFAPDDLFPAIELYRRNFKPSAQLSRPYVMPGLSVIAAETDAEARHLLSSLLQQFVNLRRGTPGPLPPPRDTTGLWSPAEGARLNHALSLAVVGSPATVKKGLADFIARTGADELICAGQIFDHPARLRSFEIIAQVHAELA